MSGSPFVSRIPECVQYHSWFRLRSVKKNSELNPKTHRLAKNHHKSFETESLESAVLFKSQVFSFKYISIQWESDKIIVNITSVICQARDLTTHRHVEMKFATKATKRKFFYRTNFSEIAFEENIKNFSTRLKKRDYPDTTVEKHPSEVNFSDRMKALKQRNKNARKKILPLVTQYHPALPNLKYILMGKWHLIQNQPYLRTDLQGASPHIKSRRKIPKRHSSKS